MLKKTIINADEIRQKFSNAMSKMYREEVPAYGTLMDIVGDLNKKILIKDKALADALDATKGIERITEERHGAIRLGTAQELNMMRRIFEVMGMYPVGYYDLSVADIPVHSTAFRPITKKALAFNPFRIFTSLLRFEFINDPKLLLEVKATLAERKIFSDKAVALVEKAERRGELNQQDSNDFILEILKTFRWHSDAKVSLELYNKLHDSHRLIADIVSFKGPHINHLTPRTLDIDAVQTLMPKYGINPKAVIEGPPSRKHPILLRQTSFKALEEQVNFISIDNKKSQGMHTARFGEIEQRGAALTTKGQALYDALLNKARQLVMPNSDGSNAQEYSDNLEAVFKDFPDDITEMHDQELAYFNYSITDFGKSAANCGGDEGQLNDLIERGLVRYDPIIYEDFLPVSAAGIFESNLGEGKKQKIFANSNRPEFEDNLGCKTLNLFDHYAMLEAESIKNCISILKPSTMVM